jgi:glutamate dehydrogenase/leucine dehydrogenase
MSIPSWSAQYTPGVITGKPVGGGGSLGRTEATGFGVIYTVREAMKHLKMDPAKSVAAIQGFGNVSQYAAIGLHRAAGRQGDLRFLLGSRRPHLLHGQQSQTGSTRAS